ncbi:MAG TPA: NAD-dependent epimerase/dehydratase family protein [Kofleriaceae bacterium]|nr:NAD-dependent epimerase/dehydratase family protein [Kofleriaceae bacterium]
MGDAACLLVTGAGGFAGGHLVSQAAAAGHRIVALLHRPESSPNRDRVATLDAQRRRLFANAPRGAALTVVAGSLTDRGFVRDLLAREAIDAIAHLAGRTNTRSAELDRAGTVSANVEATQVLAEEAARSTAVRARPLRFVFASTSRVFAGLPAPPDRADSEKAPIGAYAHSKLEAEAAIEHLAGLDTAIAYAPNLLGPGGEGTVIPTWIERALAGESIEVWGDGTALLEFLPVGAFADAILGLLRDAPGERLRRVLLRGSIRVSLAELAAAVCESLARLAPFDESGPPVTRAWAQLVRFA